MNVSGGVINEPSHVTEKRSPLRARAATSVGIETQRHLPEHRKYVRSTRRPSWTKRKMSAAVVKTEKLSLPMHFHMLGNITDPLNLNSIGQSSSPAQSTPSPRLTPNYNYAVDIPIPKHKRDPLNLESTEGPSSAKKRKIDAERDQKVSVAEISSSSDTTTKKSIKTEDSKQRNCSKFRYGNYNRYYGKRLPDKTDDPRLSFFRREWFEGKDVLDVGCNIGSVTIFLAKEFNPHRVVGLDIDSHLIGVARKNVRNYLDETLTNEGEYPESFSRQYGPISAPVSACGPESPKFPNNIVFKTGNFVPASDLILDSTACEYDTVLALSITKWVHLNWGDDGLKRFFKRIYKSLKPGGLFVLEPQPFVSYKKRKKLTVSHLPTL